LKYWVRFVNRFMGLVWILLVAAVAVAADPATTKTNTADVFPNPEKFPLPEAYKPNVEFWERVYGEWNDNDYAIHDSRNMEIVLDVIEVPADNDLLVTAERSVVKKRYEALRTILLDLDKDPDAVSKSADHKRVFDLYKSIYDPSKFKLAAENLRIQQGIKDRFRKGLNQMPLYIDQIKEAFREEGVPEEIAYLPLVESSFNNSSLSKTRAVGIFQFMSGAARSYGLTVNDTIDERLDPFEASRAAARYLRRSYELYGTWPLAITSYNHGQQGIARAVSEVGSTDFMTVLNNYQSRLFRFASRNFYAEFLAACKVMNDSKKYFGDIDAASPIKTKSVTLASPLSATALLNAAGVDREELRACNPSLSTSVIFGKRSIPAGYVLRLPASSVDDFPALVAKARSASPSSSASSSPKVAKATNSTASSSSSSHVYTVRRGDTLFSISRKFETTVDALLRLNGLSHSHITPGQRLTISLR
jgi:peptidoglycan lytic transglycosylase D